MGRSQKATEVGVNAARQRLPFRMREPDPDNHSALLNELLWNYCRRRRIGMSAHGDGEDPAAQPRRRLPRKGGKLEYKGMKTYSFKVVVEPDEDRWHAYCPALLRQGAATWGNSQQEALRNIHEVVQMVVDSLVDHGEVVLEEPSDQVRVSASPEVAVTV